MEKRPIDIFKSFPNKRAQKLHKRALESMQDMNDFFREVNLIATKKSEKPLSERSYILFLNWNLMQQSKRNEAKKLETENVES